MVTRGSMTINNFEVLLREYMNVSNRTNSGIQKGDERVPRKVDKRNNFHKQKWSDEQRRGWRKDFAPKPKAEVGPPVINSLVVDSQASGSKSIGPGNAKTHGQ